MKKLYTFLFSILFAGAALFVSCTDFFSNSLAPWAARDPDGLVPSVNTGNLDELMSLTENNPDMSLALLKRLEQAAGGASPASKQLFQSAALEVAVNAAGLGQAILGAASDLGSIDRDNVEDLVIDAINSMKNLDDAASILLDILAGGFDMDDADPNNLALAAVVLMAGEAKNAPDIEVYIKSFSPSTSGPTAQLAVTMANRAVTNGISGPFADILDGLGLI